MLNIADLPLLRGLLTIHQNSQEVSFREVMDSFDLVAYASLAVWQVWHALPTITSLFELYFKFRRFILLTQRKKVISVDYGSNKSR